MLLVGSLYKEECLSCTVFSKAITGQIGKIKSISLLQSQVYCGYSYCVLITSRFLHSQPKELNVSYTLTWRR